MDEMLFDEFCAKHGYDPKKIDALTQCWLEYHMLDEQKFAKETQTPKSAEDMTDEN